MKSTQTLSSMTLVLAGCSSTTGENNYAKPTVKIQKASIANVECSGINACKGLNSSKGKGWVPETKANCLSKGGKVGKVTKL